jgi:oligoendopeptidase F
MAVFVKAKIGSWNLDDLIKEPSGIEFQEFLESLEEGVRQLENKRKVLHNNISQVDFENILHLIETISEKVNIARGYAHLRYSAETLTSDITNRLLFFDLWYKKEIDEKNAQRLIKSVHSDYREYLRQKRLLTSHTLTEPEEKIISTLEVTGTSALVKIYDRMTSGFEFVMTIKKGKRVIKKIYSNKEKMLSLIRSTKSEEREAAYLSLLETYKKNSGVLGEIYQNLVIQWRDEHIHMRRFKSPISVRNISNNLDDATVETLLSVCRRNATVFQDYFKEKAKMLDIKNCKDTIYMLLYR